MDFSVIVAFNNSYELMSNFVENLIQTTDFNRGELILVSDACRDVYTLRYLHNKEAELHWLHCINLDKPVGYSKANNVGVRHSRGETLVFLNSDVFPTAGSIKTLLNELNSHEEVGAVQGKLIYPQTGLVQSTGHLFMGYHNTHIYAGCAQSDPLVQQSGIRQAITTAFCAIPRYLFELHSGFDEIYYNAYEGMELTLKISKAGKRCTYCANAVAFHAVGGSRNHMEFDNSIPGHIFWHRWKDKIHDDIQDYLSPQVTPLMRERTYFLMQGSSIPGWDKILQSLKLNYSEEFMLPSRFSKQIDLYRDLPFSALDSPQPYLFTVDSLSDIQGNQNWTMVRNHSQDIVMDTHGRICSMKKLNGLYRGNT